MNLRDRIANITNIIIEDITQFQYVQKDMTATIVIDVQSNEIQKIGRLEQSISELPQLLGLVDGLSQRLEEKYKDTPDDIPIDELNELLACRKIQKAILNYKL